MKKALVLAGGGTHGAYQNGAVKALRELGEDTWDIITGTSIGALNGTLIVQEDYEVMDTLWRDLRQEDVIEGALSTDISLESIINERNLIRPFFRNYVKEKGVDITPLTELIRRVFDPEKFFRSKTDFGCITMTHMTQKPVYVTKEMMRQNGADWLIASASAFPAFPVHRIDDVEYVDGGYFDNLPIDYALRMGAEELTVIDLHTVPRHPSFMDRPMVRYIFPQAETGRFLEFSREKLRLREILGYNDTMKAFGRYDGVKYTFFERYPLPGWFDSWYLELLMLETRIRIANRVSERIYSESYVTDRLEARQHRAVLNSRQIFFGMMDCLMDLSGCDVSEVYSKTAAERAVLAAFAEAADPEYAWLPGNGVRDALEYARSLDQKGIVMKIAHGILYPSLMFLTENVRLSVYPFEEALAGFLVRMMFELGEKR